MKAKYTKRQIQEAISYWKKQLKLKNYKKLNESTDDVVEGLWDEDGNGGPTDADEFAKLVCSTTGMTKKEFYEEYVPDETEEVEIQVDVDDFDTYRVNFQDTIDIDDFFEQLFDIAKEDESICRGMLIKDFNSKIYDFGKKIAEEAWELYNPSKDQMTWKGRYLTGGRYPDA